MTKKDREYIVNAMAHPCKATLQGLLDFVEGIIDRERSAGYAAGYDDGIGRGCLADHEDDEPYQALIDC